jgi:hypothetical protein
MAMNVTDSNLPLLKYFLPLMHELSYFLAAPVMVDANVQPGKELAIELQPRTQGRGGKRPSERPKLTSSHATVLAPGGQKHQAKLSLVDRALRIRFAATERPGRYTVELPKELTGRYPSVRGQSGGGDAVPFVVLGSPLESRVETLTDKDVKKCGQYIELVGVPTFAELQSAVSGGIPGEELWQWLAIGAMLALIAEIALTRWIARQRRAHELEDIEFGSGVEDMAKFRARAKEMLAYPPDASEAVVK